MPIEVRRFGAGFRRPEGPPGTHGLTGQVIHSDGRGLISELAFVRGAAITPHDNSNTTWFCVIEGGGWVLVGEERRRVAAGEAVLWPANVTHAAWTDQGEMRALVVEFADAYGTPMAGLLEGAGRRLGPGDVGEAHRGDGQLTEHPSHPERWDQESGEPF